MLGCHEISHENRCHAKDAFLEEYQGDRLELDTDIEYQDHIVEAEH